VEIENTSSGARTDGHGFRIRHSCFFFTS